MQKYIPLRAHSDYTLLRSSVTLSGLIRKCLEEGIEGLALTDSGSMYGSMEFFHLAKEQSEIQKKKFNPIIGCEIFLQGFSQNRDLGFEVSILVKNNEGYQNLVKVITESHTNAYCLQRNRAVVMWDFLKKNAEGLFFLSGFSQGIVESVTKRDVKSRDGIFKEIQTVFSERIFLEVQRDLGESFSNAKELEKNTVDISERFSIPIVATHPIFYIDPQDVYANHLLYSIEKGVKSLQKQTGHHFLSIMEMNQLFTDRKNWLDNTVILSEQCNFSWEIPGIRMPRFSVEEDSSSTQLSKSCEAGLRDLEKTENEKYRNRLLYELEVIEKMGFCDYFLVIADIVRFAKSRGILVGPGRGSAAGSLVAYTLGITVVDPIEYGLLFERFLNSERVSPPDIDIDFQDDRREEVIEYCRKRYGEKRVAHIVTYAKLKSKAVFKDVAKLEGMSFTRSNEICQLIGSNLTLECCYEENREFRELVQIDESVRKIYESAKKLEGLTRQTGTHASGVIISDRDLDEYIPLFSDKEGNLCTQYEGKILEEYCGLVKMDLLGLKCLTVLQKAITLIREQYGEILELEKISLEDKKTYEVFSQGRTKGVFQFESSGMQRYLRELQPSSIEDLTAMNAMYRPGPMNWIPVYIGKKHGEKVTFATEGDEEAFERLEDLCVRSPELGCILSPTNYIPIYQEQIMEIGQKYAGFTLRQADLMRRAMGKKKKEVLKSVRAEFVRGAQEIGHSQKNAIFLFDKIITPFSGYGFNKAHAVSYAVLSYQTAYVKSHYAECFLVSLINSDIDQPDRIEGYVRESYSYGIRVIPPDINRSQVLFHLENGKSENQKMICGLQMVKGIASSAGNQIILERKKKGGYRNFLDFYTVHQGVNSKISRQTIEQLIKAGCFDSLEEDRGHLLDVWKQIADNVSVQQLLDPQQDSLFSENWGGENVETAKSISIEDFLVKKDAEKTSIEILQRYEREGLSFCLRYDPFLTALVAASSIECSKKEEKYVCRIVEYRKFEDKNGRDMCFLRLSGIGGIQDGVVFPEVLQEWGNQKKIKIALQLLDLYKKSNQVLLFTGKTKTRFVITKVYEWVTERETYAPIVGSLSKDEEYFKNFTRKKSVERIVIEPQRTSQQWIKSLCKLHQFFQDIPLGEGRIEFAFCCGDTKLWINQRKNVDVSAARKKWSKEIPSSSVKMDFILR